MSTLQVEYTSEVSAPGRLLEIVDTPDINKAALIPGPGPQNGLTIALIGPQETARREMTRALIASGNREVHAFSSYPPSLDDTPALLMETHNVVIVELDSDPEFALQLVEGVVAAGPAAATVMVYSSKTDSDLMLRTMRAGAREYLVPPFGSPMLNDALKRAIARYESIDEPAVPEAAPETGRLLTFMGAKGGTGVTTLACNFAVAMAQNTQKSTLIIDLDLPFGDVALNLGLIPEYSTVNALQASDRLDPNLLKNLVMRHTSGLSVLATTGKLSLYQPTVAEVDKLVKIAKQSFDFVVVDIGARLDLTQSALFQKAHAVYLVTQAGIPELRNSNRLISQFFGDCNSPRLEIIINRHEEKAFGVSDADITRALTRSAHWKIPNDFSTVRQMQINATPLALANSPVSREIRRMARTLTGDNAPPEKKKFSLFG